ncbi:hypothetical protein ACHHYP_07364 [Achlya hypogyna]|uniref:Uncharacterized protein n=1 Tax=Achlya hypogyna TaxID=1202772 RepID=A0A1V9ZM04_ACHHY|nr:hypothetical protein ACHHYP_07364 [Achlya hypogyna]
MLRTNSPHEAGWCRDAKKAPGMDAAPGRQAKPLFAPRPRRVTSPELIFRDSSLDRCEKEELCRQDEVDALLGDRAKWQFRPIQRPDVELTSPPTRAGNPVILDSKFHELSTPTPEYSVALFSRPKKPRLTSLSSSC